MASQNVQELIGLLDGEYDQWEFDGFAATNKQLGIEISLGDFVFLGVRVRKPFLFSPGLLDRIRLWRALRRARERKLGLLLSRAKVGRK